MKNQSVSDFVAATMDAVLNSKEHQSLFATQYKTAAAKCTKCNKDKESCMCDSAMADDQDARKKKEDSSDADDQAAKKKKEDSSDADDNDAKKKFNFDKKKDSSDADDQAAKKKKEDSSDADSPTTADRGEYDNHFGDDKDNPNYGKSKPTGSGTGGDPYVFSADKITAKPPAQSKADDGAANDDLEPSVAFDVAIDSLLTASAALDSVGLGRGSALTLKIASLVVQAKKKDSKDKKDKKDKKKDSKDSKKSDSQSAKDKKSKDSKDSKDSKKDDKKSSKPSSSSKK